MIREQPAQRVGAIRPDPSDLSPLRIDEKLVRRMLVAFLRDETAKVGLRRAVIGLSGGVDSAAVAALAAEAFGPERVLALHTPYRTSSERSLADARAVADRFGLRLEVVPITAQIDAYFSQGALLPSTSGEASRPVTVDRVRMGNKMARERKSIEFDRAWPDGAVVGTSNKTELLLGYGTWFGDMASSLNPVGDLYKTQLRELAIEIGVPERIVAKPPTAELWPGQTDEGELGFTYAKADLILYHMVDRRLRPDELVAAGFDAALVRRIREMVRKSHYKRVMPLIAKVSLRTVGHDFLYPRDWEAD
ncbi:MAG: NAD+ synthase [Chloroflexota bacterium]